MVALPVKVAVMIAGGSPYRWNAVRKLRLRCEVFGATARVKHFETPGIRIY
jgi:hypothetical protein